MCPDTEGDVHKFLPTFFPCLQADVSNVQACYNMVYFLKISIIDTQ